MQTNASDDAALAQHIAIILDGNGRWAKARGLTRNMGHRQGAKALGPVIRRCQQLKIKFLTLYVFSTENWSRPADEVRGIMELLREHLKEAEKYASENVRIKIIGDIARLDDDLRRRIAEAEQKSVGNTGLTVCFALNYGGRQEIVHAVRQLAEKVANGALTPESIDEAAVCGALYTAGMPDPDLIIRPSGEKRISNFLLWQCAYSEFVFMDVLWPDFSPACLDEALAEFAKRSRRFGGI